MLSSCDALTLLDCRLGEPSCADDANDAIISFGFCVRMFFEFFA